tara:strand:- start:10380 stop:10598 length:219 start_codon:yes stop_codon:yes gene_type:complete
MLAELYAVFMLMVSSFILGARRATYENMRFSLVNAAAWGIFWPIFIPSIWLRPFLPQWMLKALGWLSGEDLA